MKELTKQDYYKTTDLLEEVEGILRFTKLDDEHILINNIRSYIRMRFQSEVFPKLPKKRCVNHAVSEQEVKNG